MPSAQYVWELSRAILNDQDGLIVLLKAFMDESGTHLDSPVLTVGGYIGMAREWRAFTREWQRQLPPIKVYHSTDCANLRGEFEGWSAEQRDEFVVRMLKVIRDSAIGGVVVGIVLRDYNTVLDEYPELHLLGRPYTTCFHWAVDTILRDLTARKMNNRIAFVHEHNDYHHEALNEFAYIKRYYNPSGRIISLTFAAKDEYVPLQAADILVYECNKRLRDLRRPNRRALDAINPDKRALRLRYLNKDTLPEAVRRIRDMRISGKLDE